MTIVIIVAVCIVLLMLGFLVPRLPSSPQRGRGPHPRGRPAAGGKAPGPIGRLFSKSFGTSRKATNKSASTGRKARGKMPL